MYNLVISPTPIDSNQELFLASIKKRNGVFRVFAYSPNPSVDKNQVIFKTGDIIISNEDAVMEDKVQGGVPRVMYAGTGLDESPYMMRNPDQPDKYWEDHTCVKSIVSLIRVHHEDKLKDPANVSFLSGGLGIYAITDIKHGEELILQHSGNRWRQLGYQPQYVESHGLTRGYALGRGTGKYMNRGVEGVTVDTPLQDPISPMYDAGVSALTSDPTYEKPNPMRDLNERVFGKEIADLMSSGKGKVGRYSPYNQIPAKSMQEIQKAVKATRGKKFDPLTALLLQQAGMGGGLGAAPTTNQWTASQADFDMTKRVLDKTMKAL